MPKYRLLRERFASDPDFIVETASLASAEAVMAVHDEAYVLGFLQGTLDPQVMRRIGFPWSDQLVTRTLASAGCTLAAVETALTAGFGGTLAGGTHHAFREAGAGFCVFNDLAIAIHWARSQHRIERAAVIDLDVHQGDGTAAIFANDANVFTLSLHGAHNFPLRKQRSTLDVELDDDTGDEEYLKQLRAALEPVWSFDPQLILYQAGVDGLDTDRLGKLRLTMEGLRERDRLVIGQARRRAIPLAITIGGGYSDPIERTVEAHVQTFREAANIYLHNPEAGESRFAGDPG